MAQYRFTADSLIEVHARSSLYPIRGTAHAVEGEVSFEEQDGTILPDPSPTGYVEVDAETLDSGHALQDMEMRRRIDAKSYPKIRFDLTTVSGGPDRYTVTGTLTFHGVTQEFTADATADVTDGVLRVEGTHTFNIEHHGVRPPRILKLQVYPEVRVVARLVGVPSEG